MDVSGELAVLRTQRQAIDRLEQDKAVSPYVCEWLFNSQKARVGGDETMVEISDTRLNADQRESVVKAMRAPDVFFLQGPPGTGKTTVIAELCRQMAKRHQRVLIASQANLAVDNALASFSGNDRQDPRIRPLRIIADKRQAEVEKQFQCFLRKNVVPHWLDTIAAACEREPAEASATDETGAWRDLKRRWAARLREHRSADNTEDIQKLYVRCANVVATTCARSGSPDFYQSQEFDPSFDLVVVDEVSKATPPELLMPLLLGRRAVLVGDHRQLPPVFRDDSFYEAEANGELREQDLARFKKMVTASLFEELFISAPEALRHTLREQYRMHPHIMDAVNHFYPDRSGKGILRPGGGREELHRCKQHRLSVPGRSPQPLIKTDDHVIWLDSTTNLHGRQVTEGDKRGTSRWNGYEIAMITELLGQIDRSLDGRNEKLDVGVITFYVAQKLELHHALVEKAAWRHLRIQVNTVDQFQGRECSVIIVSLVRTGVVSGEFVKDYRRINVAFSRAKDLLIIVGSERAFASAQVPISPVEGGDAKPIRVYHEIAKTVAERRGTRGAAHIWQRQTQEERTYENTRHGRNHRG